MEYSDNIICPKFLDNHQSVKNINKLCKEININTSISNQTPINKKLSKNNKIWIPVQKPINIIDNKSSNNRRIIT